MTLGVMKRLTTVLRFRYPPAERAKVRQYEGGLHRVRGAANALTASNARLAASQAAVNGAFGATIAKLGGYAAILGVAFGGREIVQAADTLDELDNRLRAVVGNAAPLRTLRDELTALSVQNFSNLDDTVQVFQRFKIGTEDVGRSTAEILTFTDSVQKSAALSGATTQETNAALIQFAQGIASNRFSGEEFRSVSEQLPTLLRVLKRDLGKTTGELREAAFAGELTAEVIFGAFERQRESILHEFERIQITQQKAAQQLQTGLLLFFGRFGQGLGLNRTLAEFYQGITGALLGMQDAAHQVGLAFRGMFTMMLDFQGIVWEIFDPLFKAAGDTGIFGFIKRLSGMFSTFNTLRESGMSAGEAFREMLQIFFSPETAKRIEKFAKVFVAVGKAVLILGALTAAFGALKLVMAAVALVFSPISAVIALIAFAVMDLNSENSKLRGLWEWLVKFYNNNLKSTFEGIGELFMTVIGYIGDGINKIREFFGEIERLYNKAKDFLGLGEQSDEQRARVQRGAEQLGIGTVTNSNGRVAYNAVDFAARSRGGFGQPVNQVRQEVTLNVSPREASEVLAGLESQGKGDSYIARMLRIGASGAE